MADGPKIPQSPPDPNEPSAAERAPDGQGPPSTSGLRRRLGIAGQELKGLMGDEERHRRLHGRLIGILVISLVLDVLIAFFLSLFDSFSDEPDRHFGRAFAWTSSQMLVGGSSYTPQTWGGHLVEVLLQGYGITVIAAIAGCFASFFLSSDSQSAPAAPGNRRHQLGPSDTP